MVTVSLTVSLFMFTMSAAFQKVNLQTFPCFNTSTHLVHFLKLCNCLLGCDAVIVHALHITDRKQMQADKQVQHSDNKGEDSLNESTLL